MISNHGLSEQVFVPCVSGETPYRVDARQINQRASLLQRYLSDEQKELQALYALQALMVHMEQPASEYPSACGGPAVMCDMDKITNTLQ